MDYKQRRCVAKDDAKFMEEGKQRENSMDFSLSIEDDTKQQFCFVKADRRMKHTKVIKDVK